VVEVKRVIDLGGSLGTGAREKISEIFADGFYGDLKMFCADRARLARACAHMFALEHFYAAVIDGEIAGVIACLDAKGYCVRYDWRELVRHLGLLRGLFAAFGFKYFSQDPKYPPEAGAGAGTASVEFVVTGARHRKMGAAKAILEHLHALPQYGSYVLEVKDTNVAAVELYRKMGYEEVYRKKFRWAKRADFEYFVYMRYSKG